MEEAQEVLAEEEERRETQEVVAEKKVQVQVQLEEGRPPKAEEVWNLRRHSAQL